MMPSALYHCAGFPTFGFLGRLEIVVRFSQWLAAAAGAVLVVGCFEPAKPVRIRDRHRGSLTHLWTADGMYRVTGRSGALFLSPPSIDLRGYRSVLPESIEIRTKRPSRDLEPKEEERLKGFFMRRLEKVFERNGWQIVKAPGENVLRLRLVVSDVKLERHRNSHFGIAISSGSIHRIAIVLELRDALTNDRRLLFGDRRRLPFDSYSGPDLVSIMRVEEAFDDFSIDFQRRLKQVRRGDFPPPPRPQPN